MKNSEKIQPEPEALKARLNQRYVTRVEALRQFRSTMPLLPHAERELQQSERASLNGRKSTANALAGQL